MAGKLTTSTLPSCFIAAVKLFVMEVPAYQSKSPAQAYARRGAGARAQHT